GLGGCRAAGQRQGQRQGVCRFCARAPADGPRVHHDWHVSSIACGGASCSGVITISKLHCWSACSPHFTVNRDVPCRPVSHARPTGPTMPRCVPSTSYTAAPKGSTLPLVLFNTASNVRPN